jgi:hypothetical protein
MCQNWYAILGNCFEVVGFPELTKNERFAAEKDYAKDLFDTEFKAVGYLLTANGAGLIGGLRVHKALQHNAAVARDWVLDPIVRSRIPSGNGVVHDGPTA